MKIKRYSAKDMKQAIGLVRDDLGSDAVILSNKKVNGMVEIVAAIDYDENMIINSASDAEVVAEKAVENSTVTPQQQINTAPAQTTTAAFYNSQHNKTPQNQTQNTDTIWCQDLAISDMRNEVKSLRNIMESHMAGMAWFGINKNSPNRAELLRRLCDAGFSEEIFKIIVDRLAEDNDIESLWRNTLVLLENLIPTVNENVLARAGILALVGPTGVGKTTTAAKMAARYALNYGRSNVALVTIDNYRVAAFEQLKIYGRIIDIPVRVASDKHDLKNVLSELSNKQFIVIDTAGMSQNDKKQSEQINMLKQEGHDIKTSLVISSTTQLSGVRDIVKSFSSYKASECVVTKLDECTSMGSMLSVMIEENMPVTFVSDGQRVPEDLHVLNAHDLITKSISLGTKYKEELGSISHDKLGRVAAHAYL